MDSFNDPSHNVAETTLAILRMYGSGGDRIISLDGLLWASKVSELINWYDKDVARTPEEKAACHLFLLIQLTPFLKSKDIDSIKTDARNLAESADLSLLPGSYYSGKTTCMYVDGDQNYGVTIVTSSPKWGNLRCLQNTSHLLRETSFSTQVTELLLKFNCFSLINFFF
jgi:hypothetical protein